MILRVTWPDLHRAIRCARYDATQDGVRRRVVREDGVDHWGPYRFRILPVEAVHEPCS